MKKLISRFAVGMLSAAFMASSALAQGLAPHVARYELLLEESRLPGNISTAGGQFLLRVERRCDEWLVFSQLDFRIETSEQAAMHIHSLSGTEEALNADRMDFRSEVRVNKNVVEAYSGRVENDQLTLNTPERKQVNLGKGIYFPLGATRHSLERIAKGDTHFSYKLYDGNGTEAMRVTDLVAGTPKPLAHPPQGDHGLLSGRQWRIVTSFFPLEEADVEPLNVSTADIYANGVTSRLTIDAGVMKASGRLTHIEALPEPSCNGG